MVSCFFWILILFSHCTKNQQRTRKQETKKPKKQKKTRNQKTKKTKKIGKKTRLHTPRGGVVAESWVLSFFQTFFCGFLFFLILVLFSHCTKNQQRTRKQETKKPKKQKKTRNQKTKKIGKKQDCTPQGGE